MIRPGEIDLFDAVAMLDVPAEVLGRIAEEGIVRSRREGAAVYFRRAEIEGLSDCQIRELCRPTVDEAAGEREI